MLKNKKVLLLTASHLSSCPRLLKEADLLFVQGADIHILYLNSLSFLESLDNKIRDKHPNWNFYPISWNGSKSNKLKVLLSKIIYKLNTYFAFNDDYIQSTSKVLIDATLNIKADLYIAHHPSLLPAVAKAAHKYKAKFIYDIEDAFPFVDQENFLSNPNKDIVNIEKKYINEAVLLSTASPLYANLYKSLYDLTVEPINLLNVFNVKQNEPIEFKDRKDLSKTSLYWFSQTVGLNRGLQDVFNAINELDSSKYELHIRGNCKEDVKYYLLSLITNTQQLKNIYFHELISNDELEIRNAEHDIGLALEAPNSLNRDLCISNKILDYISKGLMVVATNTKGHSYILSKLNANSYLYEPGNVQKLKSILSVLINNTEEISNLKSKSLKLAEDKYNWDTHSLPWLVELKKLMQ
jgi:glycosyltransferase involved in cell wall biosynthesis